MILKVFGVLQAILIQIIHAQLSIRDLSSQNVLNNLGNTPLAGYGRSRRQIDNPPVGSPGSGDLPVNDFANNLPLRNGMLFGNYPPASGLTNNFGLNNGLPNNLAFNNGLQNSFGISNGMALPFNFPFSNVNVAPQNRLQPMVNGININGLPFNIPNGLPSLNYVPNGLPSLNNVPKALPSLNNVPKALPSLNNVPNALPSFNNVPNILPNLNNVPNGLPSFNNVPNGLPSLNNVPNILPSLNDVPNGLPSFNHVPNGLPSFNNVLNGLPSLNNVPNGLTSINNEPNKLPSFNYVPNTNNLPFPNKFLNLNNVPAGINILNLNNLPAANSLPNINNILPIPNSLPSFNNLPCGNALPPLPLNKELPRNNLPNSLLPPINNQMPYLNNFRITEIGIGNGIADMNRLPRNNLPVGNMLPNANNLQSGNGLTQQVADELSNINNFKNANLFSGLNNPFVNELSNNLPVDNRFSSLNHFPISNGACIIANEAQNINNMQLNNGLPDFSNFQNSMMPVNEQRFVSNVPFNNGFEVANNFPANTAMPNAKSRLENAIKNGMALSNGGHLNEILFANEGNTPDIYEKNSDGNGFPRNDVQFGNFQVPVNHWHYDFVGAKMPDNQNVQPEVVKTFSNVPSDYQSVLMSDNLNLTQELIKNLKIEGNMPFLNGLPVAGITETVTALNGPYSK